MSLKAMLEEKALLQSCLEGDSEKYRMIVDKYRGLVTAISLSVLRNREDAEDAVQETFIKAYRNLTKFDMERSFKEWLSSITYNLCLDQLRKKKRFFSFFDRVSREPSPFSPLPDGNPEPPGRGIEPRLLNILSSKERVALLLWANESYTSEEISGVLNCAPSTARVHLYKARRKIKLALENSHASL